MALIRAVPWRRSLPNLYWEGFPKPTINTWVPTATTAGNVSRACARCKGPSPSATSSPKSFSVPPSYSGWARAMLTETRPS